MAAILAFLTTYKAVLIPIVTAIVGWLFPSPLQKAVKSGEDVHNTEGKVTDGSAPTSDLDRLP